MATTTTTPRATAAVIAGRASSARSPLPTDAEITLTPSATAALMASSMLVVAHAVGSLSSAVGVE